MIGRMRTTHPTEGYTVIVGYTKVNARVRITTITDADGTDIWNKMTSAIIQHFKAQIKQ